MKQTSSQFHRQRDTASTVTTLRCPVKRLAFVGAHAATIRAPHNNASKAEKRNRLNPWPRSWNQRNLPIKTTKPAHPEKLEEFFCILLFCDQKKYVGWRAETRRFLLLISELFWSAREIPIPQNQNQDRGVTAPLAAFLFAQASKVQIPLNPPLLKGEKKRTNIPLFAKGGEETHKHSPL